MNTEKGTRRTVWFSILANGILALAKALAGFFGNSYALIADAIESITDVFASLILLVGIKYAQRPADDNHPYGHGKIEPLLTFVVVAFLMTSATLIAYESIQHIRTPHKTPEAWTLAVLAVIILWKEISYRIVKKKGVETHSTALKAEAWHHRSDAITSVLAFLGISVAVIFGEGFETADDWAALIASGFILYNSFLIFRPAFGEVMDEHQYDELEERARQLASEVEGVAGTEKCFIRKAGFKYLIDLHVLVDGDLSVRKGHEIAHKLQQHLMDNIPNIENVLIHVEPNEAPFNIKTSGRQ